MLAAGAALLCAACESDVSGPVRTVAMAWSQDQHAYVLGPVRLATVTSLRHLRGGAGQVQVGGSVRAVASAINARGATVDQLRRQLVSRAPSDVDLAFTVSDRVAFPETAEGLQLLTAYYNLEQARAQLNTWGLSGLPAATLVLGAEVRDENGHPALTRAEMYFQPLAMHFLPAPGRTTQVPLAMNLGAMAHSLTHQAAAIFAWGGAPSPSTDQGPARDAGWNTAKHAARSMTEGLADFIAAAVTQDPRWLDHSDQQSAQGRGLDETRCSAAEMATALPVDDAEAPYDPYPLGTVLAGALWHAAEGGQPDLIAHGALSSFARIKAAAAAAGGKLTVAAILDAVVAASNTDAIPALCGLFADRFSALGIPKLPSCDGVAAVPPSDACTCPSGTSGCP
jgi:hypothetical protein